MEPIVVVMQSDTEQMAVVVPGDNAAQFQESRDQADRADKRVRAEFGRAPTSPSDAREFVSAHLQEWGYQRELIDDLKLVASELATNAVVHAQSGFTLELRLEGASLRVSVSDGSRAKPVLGRGDPEDVSGRGLRLVKTLSSNWGYRRTESGKTVWAEVPVPRSERRTRES